MSRETQARAKMTIREAIGYLRESRDAVQTAAMAGFEVRSLDDKLSRWTYLAVSAGMSRGMETESNLYRRVIASRMNAARAWRMNDRLGA